jgi:hypothetical protein
LIDSGASANYVSPKLVQYTPLRDIIITPKRQVETADGEHTSINKKLMMDISLGNYTTRISAYVFPSKFDLILGRTWLQQCKPIPDWFTDSWKLPLGNNRYTTIHPCNPDQTAKARTDSLFTTDSGNNTNLSTNDIHTTPKDTIPTVPNPNELLIDDNYHYDHNEDINVPDYLISAKEADRLIRKRQADFCLMFITEQQNNMEFCYSVDVNPLTTNDQPFWSKLVKEYADVFRDELPGLPPARNDPPMIDTGDAKPVSKPPYKTSPAELDELRRQCCKHDLFSVRHQSGQCSTMLILSLCFDSFVTSVKRYIWKSMLSAANLHKLSITEYKVVLEWITINPC